MHRHTHALHPARLALALSCFALIALGAAPAQAARVLGLHVDGEKLSPKDRADLFEVLQSKLRLYPDIELKNPPAGELTDEMIDLECVDLDADCLARLGKKYEADKVVHVEVREDAGKQVMHVRFVDVKTARVQRDDTVKADRPVLLAAALEAEVETVFGKPPTTLPTTGPDGPDKPHGPDGPDKPKGPDGPVGPDKPDGPDGPTSVKKGLLMVTVDASDAVIQLGGDYLGTGTATTELPVGEYTVRVTKPGFADVIKKVKVRAGSTTEEHLTLTALPDGPPPPDKPKPDDDGVNWVLWGVVGGVVVVGAITVIALAAGSGDDVVRGPAVLGIDAASAWRDPATIGGRK